MKFRNTPKPASLMSLAARLLIAAIGLVLVAYASDRGAGAKPKTILTICKLDHQQCVHDCTFVDIGVRQACFEKCDLALSDCIGDTGPGKGVHKPTKKDPLTKPQGQPPSGGLLDTTPTFRAPKPSGTGKVAPN